MRPPTYPKNNGDVLTDFKKLIDFASASRIVSVIGGRLKESRNGATLVIDRAAAAGGSASLAHPFRVVVIEEDGDYSARVLDKWSVIFDALSNAEAVDQPTNFDEDLELVEGDNYVFLQTTWDDEGEIIEMVFVASDELPETYEVNTSDEVSFQEFSRRLIATVVLETEEGVTTSTIKQFTRTALQWEFYFTDQNAVKILKPY